MLGTFLDAFERAAAAAVWDLDETATEDILDLLAAHSMLEYHEDAQRYRLHHLLRDFACQRVTTNEWNEASLANAQYFLDVLHTADDLYLDGGESSTRGLAMFDRERWNIEAGQSWAAMSPRPAKPGRPYWRTVIRRLVLIALACDNLHATASSG